MKSSTLRKIVNKEAVEFIGIWQTSDSLNEAVDRLSQSSIWQQREQRLGNKPKRERQLNKKGTRWMEVKRKRDNNFTTRNLARSFERYLRKDKLINLKTLSWERIEDATLINIKQLSNLLKQ